MLKHSYRYDLFEGIVSPRWWDVLNFLWGGQVFDIKDEQENIYVMILKWGFQTSLLWNTHILLVSPIQWEEHPKIPAWISSECRLHVQMIVW